MKIPDYIPMDFEDFYYYSDGQLQYPTHIWRQVRNDPGIADERTGRIDYWHNGEFFPLTPEWVIARNANSFIMREYHYGDIEFNRKYDIDSEELKLKILVSSFFWGKEPGLSKSYLLYPYPFQTCKFAELFVGLALMQQDTILAPEFVWLKDAEKELFADVFFNNVTKGRIDSCVILRARELRGR